MVWIPLFIAICLIGFWLFMLNDMLGTYDLPPCYMTLTGGHNRRYDWLLAFVALNLITAAYYYWFVYRDS